MKRTKLNLNLRGQPRTLFLRATAVLQRKAVVRSLWIFSFSSILIGLTLVSGCTNNFRLAGLPSRDVTFAPSPNAFGGDDVVTTGTFTLARVLKNPLDPNNTLDLIGDGAGTFGNICLPADGGDPLDPTSETVCTCSYSYVLNDTPEQFEVPVIYHETDLLRCNYNQIPAGVRAVNISIHLTSAGTFSNAIRFTFGGSNSILDPTDIASFINIKRYQCRDVVVVPYMLDPSVYDPFQSEDPKLSYPLDFYTGNLANAMIGFVQAAQANADVLAFWECPPVLDPERYLLNGSARQTYEDDFQVNMKIYSKAPLNGDRLIYPPQPGVFDRSSFVLAKQPSGVFTVAVNSYTSPGVVTAEGSANNSIGFGASPIPTGQGQETCPDTEGLIPDGYHWAKLWLFRASLPPRHFARSAELPSKLQSISCTPKPFFDGTTETPVFGPSSCGLGQVDIGDTLQNPVLTGRLPVTPDAPGPPFFDDATPILTSRILGGNACLVFQDCSGSVEGGGCDLTDKADNIQFPGQRGLNAFSTPLGTATGVPKNFDVRTENIDTAGARFDFLFVVSPPTVSLADMQDTSPSSAAAPYQPFRFFSREDCSSDNPDQPSQLGDCSVENAINTYGLKLHDVGTNGDPPAEDPDRAGVFPVCVLQKDAAPL